VSGVNIPHPPSPQTAIEILFSSSIVDCGVVRVVLNVERIRVDDRIAVSEWQSPTKTATI